MSLSDDRMTRRGFVVLGGTAIAVAAVRGATVPPPALADPGGVPTYESVVGYPVGTMAATSAQLDTYVQRVAQASSRVQTGLLQPASAEGRPLRYALVSDPANLARLGEIEGRMRALRRRPPAAARLSAALAGLPAFANLIANVHGNEPSGGDAMAQLLYELATRQDATNLQRLRELIIVVMPVQNPDGRDAQRRVNHFEFDLNRDWFAFTQPETVGKIALYNRFPPLVGIDLHEQFLTPPGTFFCPPDNDPVHHESSRPGLKASDEAVTPAIDAAFAAKGYTAEHYGLYDVFYPGYGDIAPNQVWGAAGVLFEVENSTDYPDKVARQFTAADAAINGVAAHKDQLLEAWAGQWRAAAAQGRAGRLAPNLTQNPASPKPRPVPDERIYGYALSFAAHAADTARLVDRLRAFEVRVQVTERPLRLGRLRPFGEPAFGPATLPAGSVVISAGQPMKHWIHILLEDLPHPPLDYYYDVSGWSNPAMMGLRGGAIGEPIPPLARRARLRTVSGAAALQRPLRSAAAYGFATDAALAQAAAFALLRQGVALRRSPEPVGALPAGSVVVPGSARSALAAAARRFGIRPRPVSTRTSGLAPARRPRVAVYRDTGAETTSMLFATSNGFATWLLSMRFGLDVQQVSAAEIETGVLGSGFDVLVVPDGLATVVPGGILPNVAYSPPGGGLSPAGLANVASFVSKGGTFLGYRSLGVAVATGAGIAGNLTTKTPPNGFTVPGCPVAMDLLGGDVATLGLEGRAFCFNVADPILVGGETTIARFPDQLLALGYAEHLDAINGTVAATVARVGSGSAHIFSFDPAYRGFVEGAQRLLGNVLLSPPSGATGGRPAAARLAATPAPVRMNVVRVAAADAAALRAAVGAAVRLPADAVMLPATSGDGLQVQAIDPDALSGHPAGWLREVLAGLDRAGVAPTMIVA